MSKFEHVSLPRGLTTNKYDKQVFYNFSSSLRGLKDKASAS